MFHDPIRRGSLLVVVTGLVAMLLSISLVVMVRMRSQSARVQLVVRDAQARILLVGALQYLQETSRLGWGSTPAEEAFGWTDIRDGEPGPRGPSGPDGTIANLGWSAGGGYPAPGAAMRGETGCWQLPPYAVKLRRTPNPVRMDPADATDEAIAAVLKQPPPAKDDAYEATYKPMWDRAHTKNPFVGGWGALDPQPVHDTYAAFSVGDRRLRPETVGLGWFRIYRETPGEHNGIPDDAGGDWYDTMPLPGHGVFIVTVAEGATRGYRFWDSAGHDFLNGDAGRAFPGVSRLEPVTAQGSGDFADEETFRTLRLSERLLWYRVQWSAGTSAGFDAFALYRGNWQGQQLSGGNPQNDFGGLLTKNHSPGDVNRPYASCGAITLVQRLEREPPRW